MERWEERARARARVRRASSEFPWPVGVALGDEALVVTVPPGAASRVEGLLAPLGLAVRVEVREAGRDTDATGTPTIAPVS